MNGPAAPQPRRPSRTLRPANDIDPSVLRDFHDVVLELAEPAALDAPINAAATEIGRRLRAVSLFCVAVDWKAARPTMERVLTGSHALGFSWDNLSMDVPEVSASIPRTLLEHCFAPSPNQQGRRSIDSYYDDIPEDVLWYSTFAYEEFFNLPFFSRGTVAGKMTALLPKGSLSAAGRAERVADLHRKVESLWLLRQKLRGWEHAVDARATGQSFVAIEEFLTPKLTSLLLNCEAMDTALPQKSRALVAHLRAIQDAATQALSVRRVLSVPHRRVEPPPVGPKANAEPAPDMRLRVFIWHDRPVIAEGLRAFLAAAPDVRCIGIETASDVPPGRSGVPEWDVLLLGIQRWSQQPAEGRDQLVRHGRTILVAPAATPESVAQSFRAGIAGFLTEGASATEVAAAVREVAQGGLYYAGSALEALARSLGSKKLSARELDVVRLVARGLTNVQIAAELGLGVATVKYYLDKAFRKLKVQSRSQLLAAAVSLGLVQPDPK